MKLKTIEVNGAVYAAVSEGKPVFVNDDGSEVAFDAPGTVATISRLNGEAMGHRRAKEAAEAAVKAFEGIDPAKAREALDKLGSIDAKKLIDAGEVDRVKESISRSFEEKLTAAERRALDAEEKLYSEMIGGAFSRSKFIADKLVVPPDMVQATFGKAFKIEDGKVVAVGSDGNKILSKSNPGEFAGFDEALALLVGNYPFKDNILKGTGAQGSNAKAGNGGGSGGVKTMTRAEFDAMPHADRAAKFKDGFKVVDA